MSREEPIVTLSVIAVVPCFHPDESFPVRLAQMAGQVDRVVVVDDSGDADARVLEALASPTVTVLRHPSNLGIAAALNTGVREALEGGAELILTVDQDTMLPSDYVARAIAVLGQAPSLPIGALAAAKINGGSILPYADLDGVAVVRIAIQSGLIVTAACFAECGLFDEALFIDVVDTEFCLRMRAHGLLIAVIPKTDLDHALGMSVPVRSRRRRRRDPEATIDVHPAWRQYFIARNNVDVFLRYIRREPRWIGSAAKHEFRAFLAAMAHGPDPRRFLLATLVGAAHGVVHRRGPMPPSLRRRLDGRSSERE